MFFQKFRLILFGTFFLGLSLTLSSCSKKVNDYQDLTEISYSTIFSQKQDRYYVYVYRPYVSETNHCPPCEKVKPVLFEYGTYALKKNKTPIYLVNINNKQLNDGIKGPENRGIGATTYEEIKVASTPFLILIENKKVTKLIDLASSIISELNQQMS